ncbi:MAG TPA: hypothetical protein PLR99_31910 [Polyangiaceae bacterium]|nr:hypothetical protein [Polyangiaceae bacterium]
MTKASKKEPRLSLFAGATTQGARLARAAPARPARPSRAKRVAGPASRTPQGRGEHLDVAVRARLLEEIDALLHRRSPNEPRVASALRALAPASHALRTELHRVAVTLLDRDALQRELWCSAVRSLGEHEPAAAAPLLMTALGRDEGGGVATLTAAALSSAPGLGAPLAKLASGGRPLVAFAAEVARVLRGESAGAHLLHLAPIIKEAHRVALATGVVLPLVHALAARRAGASGGVALAPGFAILRSAERHLGRWLAFAEAVVWTGDLGPLLDARARAEAGPESARCAWGLLAWALSDAAALASGHDRPAPPDARLTAEIAARLSDRPSAEKDLTFLFRLAERRAPSARFMLDALGRGPLADGAPIRAAACLLRDHGRAELLPDLRACAATGAEDLRGLALGALWDAGDQAHALELAAELIGSRHLVTMAWAARVRVAAAGGLAGPVVDELTVRRLQRGSCD